MGWSRQLKAPQPINKLNNLESNEPQGLAARRTEGFVEHEQLPRNNINLLFIRFSPLILLLLLLLPFEILVHFAWR